MNWWEILLHNDFLILVGNLEIYTVVFTPELPMIPCFIVRQFFATTAKPAKTAKKTAKNPKPLTFAQPLHWNFQQNFSDTVMLEDGSLFFSHPDIEDFEYAAVTADTILSNRAKTQIAPTQPLVKRTTPLPIIEEHIASHQRQSQPESLDRLRASLFSGSLLEEEKSTTIKVMKDMKSQNMTDDITLVRNPKDSKYLPIDTMVDPQTLSYKTSTTSFKTMIEQLSEAEKQIIREKRQKDPKSASLRALAKEFNTTPLVIGSIVKSPSSHKFKAKMAEKDAQKKNLERARRPGPRKFGDRRRWHEVPKSRY